MKSLIRKFFMLVRVMMAGTRNFFRNAWLNLAATAVMVVTLMIMLGAVVFNMALNDTLAQYAQQVDLVALYLEEGVSDEEVQELRSYLEADENIVATEFISEAEAFERYQELGLEDDVIEATGDQNFLPASVEVRVDDIDRIQEVNTLIEREEEYAALVDDSSLDEDSQRTIERISSTQQFLITFGLATSVLFGTISILIIFNTIRIAIYARSEEIGIMRLIGATNSFIRGPFLFEAMLNGIVAASISLLAAHIVLFRVLGDNVQYIDLGQTLDFFTQMWPLVVVATFVVGILIGVFSSMLAMARHLRL